MFVFRSPSSPKAAAFATLVLSSVLLAACSRPEPAPDPVRAVRTMVVQADTVGGERDFAAEVRARTESRLAFQVPGRLVRRMVDVGQTVKAGQPLAQIDPQDLRLAQSAAQAAVAAAEVNATQAAADLRRFRDLQAQGFISAAELQRRETTAQAAEAQLAQARAQAAVQGNQAGYGTLLAPAAGVVTATDAEPGTVLAAGQGVLRLAHAGPRDAVFSVPEDEVDGVRRLQGRTGALRVRGWGRDTDWPATVREVAAAADPATRTFLVKADLGAAPADLGQTATVALPLPPRDGLIRLPLSAVRELGGRTVVWQLDPQAMTVAAREIQVAGADGNLALVGGGLAPGAEVVTAGVHVLTDGQKVTRFVQAAAK
ncbi:efflux RND transporter periplasmic adaptor subunit [Rubrivivax albus]|uniref:Efflux RND transporter periplasmic adaptor subunit n=1 Tax=Rubrivivax albus TaxID=2499835 RepID=A0A437K1G0_9BURK|nr:efflux RND transporter periplasmic adaptor subunit [Rubrivivax albus]RVT54143.1 efflux RND transporter periplasmic adaptor subunit [Rubrivivax albus]